MNITVVVFLNFFLIADIFSYNQFVKNGTTIATTSSNYENYVASSAVDENFQQHIEYCSHTDTDCGIKEAWLKIDLRRVYSIKYVKFWYRTDRRDEKNSVRLPGYSILVSDKYSPNSTCYKDSKNNKLPSIIENECRATTQYIWFYQQYASPEDCAPVLEICEVQVYGCDVGYYGEDCSMTCGMCKSGTCDIVTGQCDDLGCIHQGFQAPACNGCDVGFYGGYCSETCGLCESGTCDRVTGQCDELGCIHQGFQAPACNGCDVGFYGEDCSKTCGLCKSGTCDTVTGQCDDLGCAYSGFKVPFCNECLPGFYGPNCTCTSLFDEHCMNITCNRTSCSYLEDSATENKGNKSNERVQVGLFCTDMMPILFSIIAVFCISLILNVVTITWICREKRNQREQAFDTATSEATVRPNPNNANEDNKEYHELNEINREYQELGHINEPSLYEKLDG